MSSSAFDKDVCCLWNGYITNSNRTDKTQFVNFFFKDKKVMLHRLLYVNYIGTSVKAYDAIILYIYLLEILCLRQNRV
jgi:hypothetical protein